MGEVDAAQPPEPLNAGGEGPRQLVEGEVEVLEVGARRKVNRPGTPRVEAVVVEGEEADLVEAGERRDWAAQVELLKD